MLSVIMLSVIMLSVIMLSVIMPSVVMLSVVMLSVIMRNVIMLSVNMLSVIMLSAVMLSAIMMSVVAPCFAGLQCNKKINQQINKFVNCQKLQHSMSMAKRYEMKKTAACTSSIKSSKFLYILHKRTELEIVTTITNEYSSI
jgi:hypothetical protein